MPLSLSDAQLDIVNSFAKPLDPDLRGPLLEGVARLLHDQPIGDGSVHRACAEMQREFWTPPDLARTAGTSKYR